MSKASEALIKPLREAHDIAEKEHEEAVSAKQAILDREREARIELSKIQGALQRFDPEYEPPAQKKKKGRKRGNGNGISLDKLEAGIEEMRKLSQKDGYFTQSGIRSALKLSPSQASVIFSTLREQGVIRKGGKVEGSSAEKWAIMDEGAFNRYVEERRSDG